MRRAHGFTFIEVLACLLVLSLGIAATVALTYYAMSVSVRAQAKATGMATALSVALDPAPLMHQGATAHWNSAGASGIGTTTGYVNGYYVVRVEKPGSTPCPGFTSDPVSVDVYDGFRSSVVASYSTRVMHQVPAP
jgi:prepilin-type N-terminal cleavage/methylation domain-containing protein